MISLTGFVYLFIFGLPTKRRATQHDGRIHTVRPERWRKKTQNLEYSDAEYTNMTQLQYNRPDDKQTRISPVISNLKKW